MSDSLKADVKKAVQSTAPVKKEEHLKLKDSQVLLHCHLGSPQKLNENADTGVVKKND